MERATANQSVIAHMPRYFIKLAFSGVHCSLLTQLGQKQRKCVFLIRYRAKCPQLCQQYVFFYCIFPF